MKLKEIYERVQNYEKILQSMPYDQTELDWKKLDDARCLVLYKDLPLSLQKAVRQRHTPDTLRNFLHECYSMPEFLLAKLTDEQKAKIIADHYDESFEGRTKGIPEETLTAILIKARNTAAFTIEFETQQDENSTERNILPLLYGNHACDAFEAACGEYRERERKKQKEITEGTKTPAQRKQRPSANEMVSAGYYQYTISDKQYQHALTPQQNKYGYIALMTPEYFDQFDFKDGIITIQGQDAGHIKQYSRGKYEDLSELDLPLLFQIYTAAHKAHLNHEAYTITVSMPAFFREMGIETKKGNAPDIMRKLHSFENCVGIMPGQGTLAKLFSIIMIDTKAQTMTFAIPYISQLLSVLDEKNKSERTTKAGELISFIKPYNNSLVHSAIASERNKTAAELVYVITNGLLQRGSIPDAKTYSKKKLHFNDDKLITYSVSFRTLINAAPLLRSRIASYSKSKTPVECQNRALQRAFSKAYELITSRTDAQDYFIDLNVSQIIPTMPTLDTELTITHHGINGTYKKHT